MSVQKKVLVAVAVALAAAGGMVLAATGLAPGEGDPAAWGKLYPLQYKSYLKNAEMSGTDFGGSKPVSKLEQAPYLKELFAGMPFSVEYKEDRGHTYSLEDVRLTQRKKPSASCLSCKSADVPGLIKAEGVGFYALPFEDASARVKNPVACLNCHDPATMKLRLSQPALVEALRKQGRNPDTLTRQELRTLVCAQCHVEYYFRPQTKEVAFPWDKGMRVADVERFYDEQGFKDWTHPRSGTDLIKIQHPEVELFQSSVHAASGVTCADCHMPRLREGNASYTSHWWTSPLKTLEESCGGCHAQSPAELKERVLYTQQRTAELLKTAGLANVAAIEAIEAAAGVPGADPRLLQEARALHRKAQLRWDWVAAENSTGFHNPPEALYVLGQSIELARRAELTARRAAGK
ncbi:MAG: ammonia-forming cytochrome c nitrite reductase subunit c552 [Bacillota bacterium]|nr:ammonia-forming cytochrome c nitrite reductase subunit c552 [Bacillota bacterium]